MKNILITFFCLIFSLHSFAQTSDYLVLEGKIGEFPVNMELSKAQYPEHDDESYTGFYYYQSQEIPIELYQADSLGEDLNLTDWGDEDKKELFSGKLDNGVYKGIWTKGNKNFPFELKQASSKDYTEIVHLNNSIKVPIETDKTADIIAGSYEYDFFVPKDLNLQRQLIQKIDSSYDDFKSYTNRNFQAFEKDYKAEIKEFLNEVDEIHPFMMNYIFHESFVPVMNSKNYLVMRYSGYQYTGGAHGMSHEFYLNYDKKKQKWIEINDVLNEKFEIQINMVLDKAVRKEHNIPDGIKLSDAENSFFLAESIYYSKNFTLSKKGITFHYGLYELTPYVYGFFSLFVPYEDLKMYMQKDFKY